MDWLSPWLPYCRFFYKMPEESHFGTIGENKISQSVGIDKKENKKENIIRHTFSRSNIFHF